MGEVNPVNSQSVLIKGRVLNEFTKEPIPFAGIYLKQSGYGVISDSSGHYSIKQINRQKKDTLVVTYVGYIATYTPINPGKKDTLLQDLFLSQLQLGTTVEVKSKFNKGLRWWGNVVKNKAKNNPFKYANYSYELYNKLELDISRFKKETITDRKLLKPFAFILNNVDSVSDQDPFLPVYMTETLSNFYYTSNPYQSREEIIAAKTDGIKNESVLAFIGGVNQRINVYNNATIAMGKEFISPLSDYGDKYYNYKGADTQYIGGQAYFHLLFTPKKEGENTFSGDCWIHGGNWGIQKINLQISQTANINFVNRMGLVQEFHWNDSSWQFVKDKTVIDFTPFGKEKVS
ncbi:MAG: carboxypeptidase-like regulatory domain-containing protein, partial [Chitinophagia bacterium]|nr:carboxypeptidase-like regulatory domain-containing protein [Chitinophagia bacterium]